MNDEKDIENFYQLSEANQIEFFGKKEIGDLKGFFKVVDFFASRYGLGSFKSLEEFAEMINQTDPLTLNYLKICAVENENEKWGGGDDSDNNSGTPTPTHVSGNNLPVERSKSTNFTKLRGNGASNRQNVRNMLREFGVDKKDLDKACSNLDGRKIELKDYRWIDNAELLTMSEDKFKETLKDIGRDNKKSANFNVSDETIRQKYRKMAGDKKDE